MSKESDIIADLKKISELLTPPTPPPPPKGLINELKAFSDKYKS